MDVPPYEHADASSDFTVAWKFYYTHQRNMDTPHYVQVDVPLDYFC